MSYNHNSDYRRNKNTPDLVYTSATGEEVRYHKTEKNRIQLISTDDKGNTQKRYVLPDEMTVEQFEALKQCSDNIYRQIDRSDVRESRNCVSLTGYEDIAVDTDDPPDEVVVRREIPEPEAKPDPRNIDNAFSVLNSCLTEKQKKRYICNHYDGYSTRKIAESEGVAQRSVMDSIELAEKNIQKFLEKAENIPLKTPSK